MKLMSMMQLCFEISKIESEMKRKLKIASIDKEHIQNKYLPLGLEIRLEQTCLEEQLISEDIKYLRKVIAEAEDTIEKCIRAIEQKEKEYKQNKNDTESILIAALMQKAKLRIKTISMLQALCKYNDWDMRKVMGTIDWEGSIPEARAAQLALADRRHMQ